MDHRVSAAALVSRYAELMDAGDFAGVGDLLADAELTFEGQNGVVVRGAEQIAALYAGTTRRYPNGTPRTKHVITNVVVEVDPEAGTAASRSYFTVLQAVPGALALQPVAAGRYRHRYQWREGSWRITAMHVIIDLVGELGHHLLVQVPAP